MKKTFEFSIVCLFVLIASCRTDTIDYEQENGKFADVNYNDFIYQWFTLGIPSERLYPFEAARVPEGKPSQSNKIETGVEHQSESAAVTVISPSTAGPKLQNDSFIPKLNYISVVRKIDNIRFCEKIDNRLHTVSFRKCLDSEMNSANFRSLKGEPIFYTDFPEVKSRKALGRVLMLGGVHGDELTSVSSVFTWINTLKQHHSGLFVWRIVPLVNPDGFFLAKPSRTNANGVDLNRNLPTENWSQLAIPYWEAHAGKIDRKFPGLSAGSEPETQWLINEIEQFAPDVIVSIHAPYNLVDYDAIDRIDAPRRLGILPAHSLGTFPGSLGRYAGEEKDIPVITIELPDSNRMPREGDVRGIWVDLVSWLRYNITNRGEGGFVRKEKPNTFG